VPDELDNPAVARILIAEDQMIVAEDLELTLADMGHEVVGKVPTGELAVKLAEESQPDLILMDISLRGEIDGIQASEQIRSRLDIPVIYLTAYEETDTVFRAKMTEPYGFLAKPFSSHILKTTIETALYKHAADKRVKESEQRYRTLVEQSIDGIALIQGTTIRFVNSACKRMFGLDSNDEIEGQDFLAFVAPEFRDLMEKRGYEREEGKPVPNSYEFTALRKDGTLFAAEIRVNLTTYRGKSAMQAVIRDITERKKVEKALLESEKRYRALFEGAAEGILVADVETKKLCFANPAMCKMFGYTSEEMVQLNVGDIHPAESIQEVAADFDAIGRKDYILAPSIPCLRKDGSVFYADIAGRPIDIEGRQMNVGFFTDITERKRTEEDLAIALQRITAHMDNSPLAVVEFDPDFRVIRWSDGAERVFGWAPEQVMGRSVYEMRWMRDEDKELVCKETALLLSGARTRSLCIHRNYKKDGSVIDCEWYNSAIYDSHGRLASVLSLVLDITERKKAEEGLQESEERYRRLFEDAPLMYVITRNEHGAPVITDCNEMFLSSLGYLREEVLGKPLTDFYSLESRTELLERGGYVRALAGEFFIGERELLTRRGTFIPALCYAAPERDPGGEVIGTRGMFVDISDRKRAEEALRESEEKFRLFMDNSPTIAWTKDEQGRYVYLNKTHEKYFGLQLDDWLGKSHYKRWPQEIADSIWKNDQAVLASGQPMEVIEEAIYSDGQPCTWLNLKFPFQDASGKRYVGGIGIDVTLREKLQRELGQSEERFRMVYESGMLGMAFCEADGRVLDANDAYLDMIGCSREDLLNNRVNWKDITSAEHLPADFNAIEELKAHGVCRPYEKEYLLRDGTRVPVVIGGAVLAGCSPEIIAFALDITHRKKAEEQIKASLKEKEVLLREIHHRVRNNLTLVSSLLRLQARYAKDEYHLRMFTESEDRIRAMALAHEKLYQTENLASINSKNYLRSLVRHLLGALGKRGSKVQLEMQVEEAPLDLETCCILGFIVTELVSNCLKHAFSDHRAGKISLFFKQIEDPTFALSVADDGIGMPENIQLQEANTMGLNLVRIFTRQLGGHVEVRRDHGTEVILTFNLSPSREVSGVHSDLCAVSHS